MRVFVLFDLPSVSKKEKRSYVKFRNFLLDNGFIMMQFSIYMRFCRNTQDATKHVQRIKGVAPNDGNIRLLMITEHQYEEMILIIGEKSDTEEVLTSEYVTVIE